jgi:hypothetical protein
VKISKMEEGRQKATKLLKKQQNFRTLRGVIFNPQTEQFVEETRVKTSWWKKIFSS